MIETFKILNDIDKVQHEHISPISRTATRSHNQKVYKKNSRTNTRKCSFSQRIVDMWNSLPKQVLETKTVNTFKSQLNNYWKNLEIKFSPDVYRPEEKSRRVQGVNLAHIRDLGTR
jgi:predicted nucleotidyltransferase